MSPDARTTVVVVDPYPVFREGLPGLLRDEGIAVCASAHSAALAVPLLERHEPDLVLLAEHTADGSGLDVLGQLVRAGSSAAIVLHVDGEESPQSRAAMVAGAAGVVSRVRPVTQLARALRTVASGGTWFNESDWIDAPLTPAAQQAVPRQDDLSEAERRVLAFVAAGASTEHIAETLVVSPHTVRTHVRNLMRKLDAQSRAHAVAIAIRDSAIDL